MSDEIIAETTTVEIVNEVEAVASEVVAVENKTEEVTEVATEQVAATKEVAAEESQ